MGSSERRKQRRLRREAEAVDRDCEWPASPDFGILGYIPNELLHASDLPAADLHNRDYHADRSYHAFALTFNGYGALGHEGCGAFAHEARRRWQNCGELPATLTELRSCLFFEQRAFHWTAAGFAETPFATAYVRALVDAMRRIVSKDDLRLT